MNYSGKINLLKFKNACFISVAGKSAVKKGVFIPLEDNNIFVSADEELKAKGAYFDFTAWENQMPSKYGDSHSIRQSLPKEVRERMTEEQLKAVPYLGNMKPYELQNGASSVSAPVVETQEQNDLPFQRYDNKRVRL